jgi:phosphopantetheinyl transferase (holo-ACP synthase)
MHHRRLRHFKERRSRAKVGCALWAVKEVFFKRITLEGRHLAQQILLYRSALCGFKMNREKDASTL